MEQTECSETSAFIIQAPGNYPKEKIIYSEHGESLKSRIFFFLFLTLVTEKAVFARDDIISGHSQHMWAQTRPHRIIGSWYQQKIFMKYVMGMIWNTSLDFPVFQQRLMGNLLWLRNLSIMFWFMFFNFNSVLITLQHCVSVWTYITWCVSVSYRHIIRHSSAVMM